MPVSVFGDMSNVPPMLTNGWVNYVWDNYSITIMAIPIIITFFLKLIAIYNPRIKSSEITELIEKSWPFGNPKMISVPDCNAKVAKAEEKARPEFVTGLSIPTQKNIAEDPRYPGTQTLTPPPNT